MHIAPAKNICVLVEHYIFLVPGPVREVKIPFAMPSYSGRIFLKTEREILDIAQLRLFLDHPFAVFHHGAGHAPGYRGAPRSHASLSACGDNRALDLFHYRGPVARFVFEVYPKGSGIAQDRRGVVLLDEETAVFGDLPQKGLRLRVVRAVKGGIFAILLEPGGNLFEDELLGSGDSHVAHGVGSSLK